MTREVDLNADVGESYGRWELGDDDALLPHLTSANVACGFHGGDPVTLVRTVRRAAELGVTIGAQVSYPDLVGFGRRVVLMEAHELEAAVLYQLAALSGLARTAGSAVRYVKPHGALYHRVMDDEVQAAALVEAVVAFAGAHGEMGILTSAGGVLADLATGAGLRVVHEGFADRRYGADGRLAPRSEAGAVHAEAGEVAAQAVTLAATGRFGSLCVHGDTTGAPQMAAAVRAALADAGVTVRSCWE